MRKSLAVPSQMFAHSPKLPLTTGRLESPGVIKQHLEAEIGGRHPWFRRFLWPLVLQYQPCLLFLAKKPWGSERGSSDQHTIDPGVPHATDKVVITVHIPVAEQQSSASPHDLRRSGNGGPIRFPSIHLLQGVAMQRNDSGLFLEELFYPSVDDHHVIAEACFDR